MAYTLSITSQPTKEFIPAYRPVIFDLAGSCDASGEAIVSVRADIYKDGEALVSQRCNFPTFTINGTAKNYSIEFDIEQSIQDSLETDFLTAQHANYYVVFTAEKYNSGSKYLEDTDATVTSNTLFAVNSTLQHTDVQNLDSFFGSTFKLTTNAPNVITGTPTGMNKYRFLPVTRNNNIYTSFLFNGTSTAQTFTIMAKFYNDLFSLLGTKTVISGTSHKNKDFIPVDISLSVIDDNGDYLNASYFTIQISYGANSSNIHGYKIMSCSPELTIHFMNQYGGYDTYCFWDKEEDYTMKSSQFERPLPSSFDRFGRGSIAMQQSDSMEIKVSNDKLTPDWLYWLRELQSSPDVYYEKKINGSIEAIPAVIKDSTNVLFNSAEGSGAFNLSIIPANNSIIQRN